MALPSYIDYDDRSTQETNNLRDYVIDINGKSLENRLQLIRHLEALGEKVYKNSLVRSRNCDYSGMVLDTEGEWSCSAEPMPYSKYIPISIEDFIAKFPLPSQKHQMYLNSELDITSCEFNIGDFICYNQEARDSLTYAKGTRPNKIIGQITKITHRTKEEKTPLLEYKEFNGKIDSICSGWVTKYVPTPNKNLITGQKSKPVAQQEPIQSLTKETFMSKIKDTALTTVGQNKQALVIASKMEAGRIINKQVLKQLTPHLPFFLQGYTKSPFAPFVAANLVAMVANHTGNSKLTKVSDLMLLGAADSGVAAFNLDKIVDDILSNIKLPAGVLDDSDDE